MDDGEVKIRELGAEETEGEVAGGISEKGLELGIGGGVVGGRKSSVDLVGRGG